MLQMMFIEMVPKAGIFFLITAMAAGRNQGCRCLSASRLAT